MMSYESCDYFVYLLGETISSGTGGVTSERRKLDVQYMHNTGIRSQRLTGNSKHTHGNCNAVMALSPRGSAGCSDRDNAV
jgi:hypothetical protein